MITNSIFLPNSILAYSDNAPDYYVVAPDLLGHGMTPESNSYQIEDFVANMLPRITDRNIDLLIGHSLGGPVSLGLYPHLKTKPKRFVLVDPVSLPFPVNACRSLQHTITNFSMLWTKRWPEILPVLKP